MHGKGKLTMIRYNSYRIRFQYDGVKPHLQSFSPAKKRSGACPEPCPVLRYGIDSGSKSGGALLCHPELDSGSRGGDKVTGFQIKSGMTMRKAGMTLLI
jgi:hypothetical protein